MVDSVEGAVSPMATILDHSPCVLGMKWGMVGHRHDILWGCTLMAYGVQHGVSDMLYSSYIHYWFTLYHQFLHYFSY